MHLTCGNHALRCPKVPGIVCTVVPASGSRSNSEITLARHRGKAPPSRFRACSTSPGRVETISAAARPNSRDSRHSRWPNSGRYGERGSDVVGGRVLARRLWPPSSRSRSGERRHADHSFRRASSGGQRETRAVATIAGRSGFVDAVGAPGAIGNRHLRSLLPTGSTPQLTSRPPSPTPPPTRP
jgi:hypothetical protein